MAGWLGSGTRAGQQFARKTWFGRPSAGLLSGARSSKATSKLGCFPDMPSDHNREIELGKVNSPLYGGRSCLACHAMPDHTVENRVGSRCDLYGYSIDNTVYQYPASRPRSYIICKQVLSLHYCLSTEGATCIAISTETGILLPFQASKVNKWPLLMANDVVSTKFAAKDSPSILRASDEHAMSAGQS